MANIPGTQDGNTLTGTTGADSIVGFAGNDSVIANGGNDTVWAGAGNDTVLGGDGNDLIYGDADRLATWGYRVYDRDFTSANGQAFTIESGTLRGSGLSTGFDVTGHALAARGTTGDPNDFGIIYTSTFTATTAGTYTFRTTSDDGSTLRLLNSSGTPLTWTAQSTGQNGLTYLNNDFHQGAATRQANVTLAAGETYTIEVRFWENLGANSLTADVRPPGSATWQSLTNNTTYIGTGVYAGNDSLDGGTGNDTLYGEAGNDTLVGGAGDDLIYGGTGDDSILFGPGNDTVYGGDGNDLIDDEPGTQLAGNDLVYGGNGNDTVWAGLGNDTLYGDDGDDILSGEGDNDQLFGGTGNDQLFGGDGDDTLTGGFGNDLMYGGDGSDRFILDDNHGTNTIFGGENGAEIDVIDATAVAGNLTVNVTGLETGTISGAGLGGTFAEIERLELGSGNDTVTVANATDAIQLDANGGTDTLVVNGAPILRENVTIPDSAVGVFTPANGNPPIAFGPAEAVQISDILATYLRGAISITGGTSLSGTVGQVGFEDFENLSFDIICFARGTRLRTAQGQRRIEDLRAGDMVATLDHGLQPIRWIGSTRVPARGDLAPIMIRKGALGNRRDLRVSPQHRMLLRGWQASLLFGEDEVLVPAKSLLNDHNILREEGGEVEYFHILFDRHEILWAEGALSESFHPGQQGWKALDQPTRTEILHLFPQLADQGLPHYGPAARLSLRDYEGRTLRAMMDQAPRK